jgi:large-conductance mechanosensitive channel
MTPKQLLSNIIDRLNIQNLINQNRGKFHYRELEILTGMEISIYWTHPSIQDPYIILKQQMDITLQEKNNLVVYGRFLNQLYNFVLEEFYMYSVFSVKTNLRDVHNTPVLTIPIHELCTKENESIKYINYGKK